MSLSKRAAKRKYSMSQSQDSGLPSSIFRVDPASREIARGLHDAACQGDLRGLHVLFEIMKEDNLPEHGLDSLLLPEAAKNGQADVLRYLFDTLPHCQRPFPWDGQSFPSGIFCVPLNYQDYKLQLSMKPPFIQYNIPKDALEGLDAPATIKVLLDYGMSVNQRIDTDSNLLQRAVQMNKCDVVELLLDHGADIDCKMPHKHVLIKAIRNDDPDMISLLIKHGASMEDTNAFNDALVNRRIASVKKLLELGADINDMSIMRHHRKGGASKVAAGTPLHRVIRAATWKHGATCSRKEMVRLLLENGAKADIVYGKYTPFGLARYKKERGVVEVFREFGIEK